MRTNGSTKQVTMLVLIAFTAAATVGGVGAAVAPEFNFGLVKPVICPRDTWLEYKEGNTLPYRDNKGYVSNRTDVFISCVAQDGTRSEGKAFQAKLRLSDSIFWSF